jgi:hypothetical protein
MSINSDFQADVNPRPLYCADPVFILASSRSGSTLLRFILDSHPDLACPPETNVTGAALHLLRSWSVLEQASSQQWAAPANTPLPVPVIDSVRRTLDFAYRRYLERRGKKRWCDKSVETPMYASILTMLYPQARFLCLYRHCMDVIASGIEISPWGLSGFGFSSYAAQNPGNSVEAIASYWADCSSLILKYERANSDRCYHLRYEDLVADPELAAAGVFSFLGVAQCFGITQKCFEVPHDERGPGDEKIWFTNRVSGSSVGSGRTIPSALISPGTLSSVNELLADLGYPIVDDTWNSCSANGAARGQPGPQHAVQAVLKDIEQLIKHQPAAEAATGRWPAAAGRSVSIVVEDETATASLQYGFPGEGLTGSAARIAASPETWRLLLTGRGNLATFLRRGELTWSEGAHRQWTRSDLLQATAWLLGIAAGPHPRLPRSEHPGRA